MTDIARTATAPDSLGFDWALLGDGALYDQVHYNVLTPCNGIIEEAVRLERYQLDSENTLDTAVILSLFSDRRASVDDRLPYGESDRRGWCGDELNNDAPVWGSLLWLGYYGKRLDDRLEFMRFAAEEALQWMIESGVASRVVVSAEWDEIDPDRMNIRPLIYRPDDVNPIYKDLWSLTIKRHPNA
jgi:phage gp46-like protein